MNDFKGFETKYLHDMMKVWSPALQIFIFIIKKKTSQGPTCDNPSTVFACLHNKSQQQSQKANRVAPHGNSRDGTNKEWPNLVLQNRNDDYLLRQITYNTTHSNII